VRDWQRFSNGACNVGNIRAAMEALQLKTWTLAEFGAALDYEEELSVVS
jgi:hypothetical protein